MHENKILFKRLKQDRKVKTYKNLKKINNDCECEIGTEYGEMMPEWIAEMSCYKKPPRRLPRDKDVFV